MRFLFVLLSFGLTLAVSGQTKYTVSGVVKDAKTGEELIGAVVFVKDQPNIGATTNNYGFYSLTLAAGNYILVYKYLGYENIEQTILLNADKTVNLELSEQKKQLEELVVSDKQAVEKVQDKKISVVAMDIKSIKAVPALFGEVDILKTIQLLPGIQGAGEGNAGLNVRGGASDQNLILLDEAPVYNASHLMGFFSVFNSDAIKDLEVYKGGIPAKYGGRLSSLIDVRMRDGNSKQFGLMGGIGTIASRLTVEGPTFKDRGSFLVSGRRTYADMFLKLSPDKDIRSNQLYFYDLNLKTNYRINDNNRLFLSGYFGRDVFGFASLFGFDWGNATGTLRWNHLFNKRLFSNITAVYSKFDYGFKVNFSEDQNFRLSSGIRDYSMKADLTYYQSSNSVLYFGGISTFHQFSPGKVEPLKSTSIIGTTQLPTKNALESAIYVDYDVKFSPRLTARAGLRYTLFNNVGAATEYVYAYDPSSGRYISTGKNVYDKGQFYHNYGGLEPRAAVSYNLDEDKAIKGSYNRTYQFLHQASNSATTLPTDLWLPSSPNIKPQISDQVAVGYFQNLKGYEFSVETYYKWMQNQIDYRDNAQLFFNDQIEGELLFGKRRSKGFEFFFKKNQGNTQGWISYTLAWTERSIDGINNGDWYYVKNDRRHNLNIVVTQKLSQRVSVAATFVYASGTPVTFPIAAYEVDGQVVPLYGERNSYRMPDYHRLDLSLTLENKKKPGRRFESSWNFSVYNAYARENAYAIVFRQKTITNPDGTTTPTDQTEAVQIALFKIIPSITWNFKF